jgi:ABC-type Na+ efflux pump permease subunit
VKGFLIAHAFRIVGLVVIAMVAATVFALTRIPAWDRVPIQYDLHGDPVHTAPALIAFALIPLFTLLGAGATLLERRWRAKETAQRGTDTLIWLGSVAVLAAAHAYLIAKAL